MVVSTVECVSVAGCLRAECLQGAHAVRDNCIGRRAVYGVIRSLATMARVMTGWYMSTEHSHSKQHSFPRCVRHTRTSTQQREFEICNSCTPSPHLREGGDDACGALGPRGRHRAQHSARLQLQRRLGAPGRVGARVRAAGGFGCGGSVYGMCGCRVWPG